MTLGLSQIGATLRHAAPPVRMDELALFRMGSQDRIQAETQMRVEAARRDLAADNQARAKIRPLGAFVDLRV